MKNIIIKVSSFIIGLTFVLQMIPVSTYAVSPDLYKEELDFKVLGLTGNKVFYKLESYN